MIIGIGCDIVQNDRFVSAPEDVIKRILSEEEMAEYNSLNQGRKCEFVASRFALREAFAKASKMPVGLLNGKNLIIKKEENGAPFIVATRDLCDKISEMHDVDEFFAHASLSHEKEYSIAFVILESESEE